MMHPHGLAKACRIGVYYEEYFFGTVEMRGKYRGSATWATAVINTMHQWEHVSVGH